RIEEAADPLAELRRMPTIREEPATPLRSVNRFFVSDVEDKPWFDDPDGIARCGRPIELDLRVKGIDHELIRLALAKGLPLLLSTKYCAEHMGLPYHQAAIRELERHTRSGEHRLANPERRFTRYGYADLLREDRQYAFSFRLWPGTQRVLLWGDPAMAAAYARHSHFCGSIGLDLCEPLTFKGRQGSGSPGGRNLYADPSARPARCEHENYRYWYRLWGRLLYDPDADPATWRRGLVRDFGRAAAACEAGLAAASRILPLLTTAHLPSAANNSFWPEMYTNMPIVNAGRPHPYGDTPAPKTFTAVSPLDPALFYRIDDYAADWLAGVPCAKYSPLQVADWLEEMATIARRSLAEIAPEEIPAASAFRRLAVDVGVQAGLGLFFAHKLRAGVAYALFRQSGDYAALRDALAAYRSALLAWEELVATAGRIYRTDLAFGEAPHKRGHWADRIAAITADLDDMEAERQGFLASQGDASPTIRHVPLRSPPQGMALDAVRFEATMLGWKQVQAVYLQCRTDPGQPFETHPLTPDPSHPPLWRTTIDLSREPGPVIGCEYSFAALDRDGRTVARWPESGTRVARLFGPIAAPICRHRQPDAFGAGDPLPLSVDVLAAHPAAAPAEVRLHYRRVNQADAIQVLTMDRAGDTFCAVIAAEYTASPFPLLYFFEVRDTLGRAFLWPGLDATKLNQPYFVVRQSR
ncbi:MAG TPA: hypothetical protein VF234_05865, partial [Limnochordia bacterium]